MSLNNLARMLCELGRREEALEATEEAVHSVAPSMRRVRRRSRPIWRLSLNNLAILLAEFG